MATSEILSQNSTLVMLVAGEKLPCAVILLQFALVLAYRRIARGDEWRHLVPDEVAGLVSGIGGFGGEEPDH